MKYLLLLLSALSISLYGQTKAELKAREKAKEDSIKQVKKNKAETWELARIFKSRIIIRDTTRIGTILKQYDNTSMLTEYMDYSYGNYLEPTYFYQFIESILKIARTKNVIVYIFHIMHPQYLVRQGY